MRLGTNSEAPMQASKWLKSQFLIDLAEMRSLFETLTPFSLYLLGSVFKPGGGLISHETFLETYGTYVAALQEGRVPLDSSYRQLFSSLLTTTPDALYAVEVGPEQQLVRIARPVIQILAHRLAYSQEDGKFRSMVFGPDSIVWGLQLSYPQLYENPATSQIEQVVDSPQFPNTALFKEIQRWVRHHTVPTPFLVGETLTNVPIRLGKQCFSWINRHPQLVSQGIKVKR
jgi:hypothetical protein